MRRVAQLCVLVCLGLLALSHPAEARPPQLCQNLCFFSAGHCYGSGGDWWIQCGYLGQYYDAQNDTCELDAGCDYRPAY